MMDREAMEALLKTYQKSQRVNYDDVLKKVIKSWQKNHQRPRILMHTCCAPCSTVMLENLCEYADVTVYFSNSNIYPRIEYERRVHVQRTFIDNFNADTEHTVAFIEAPYEPNRFVRMVKEGKLEAEPEGGRRCNACFDMRLDAVAKEAVLGGFDYFGSALTLSPHKNSQTVNALGFEISKVYDVQYLPSDFKKNGGFNRSIELCDRYDVYRQCYCGCIFSAIQQQVDLKQTAQEARDYFANHPLNHK